EGFPEREEDLRQVQGDPTSRSGHGDLREPAAQAAAGL
ncbi:MAG: LSU ribosomal protein L36p @ LSU ribosomal protein L36p, zinc-dependent, partial [uncultured Nocardioidaceae bacterium]